MRSLAFLALLVALSTGTVLPQDDYTQSTGQTCPLAGTATKAALQALNVDKNRSQAPAADDIDTDVSLAAMLAPGDDEGRFDTKKAARIVGFVVNVKAGGVESCNCKAKNPLDRDTHIELALSPDAPANQRVIVEVTPRLRKLMSQKNPAVDWTTRTLQSHGAQGIKGKWVEVTGWLLFDFEHTDAAENTSPGKANNWRATCWEIHPVTDLQVLPGPPLDTPALHPATLRLLQHAHVQQVRRDPARQVAIERRNKSNRETFGEEEKPAK